MTHPSFVVLTGLSATAPSIPPSNLAGNYLNQDLNRDPFLEIIFNHYRHITDGKCFQAYLLNLFSMHLATDLNKTKAFH